ncbi:MAG TPA: SGNH/GDSL hydrolase family protein [Polyangiales bacterium]
MAKRSDAVRFAVALACALLLPAVRTWTRARSAQPDRAAVRFVGRVDTQAIGGPRFAWSGTGFEVRFAGSSLRARLRNESPAPSWVMIRVDRQPARLFEISPGVRDYPLADQLSPGVHTLALQRETEGQRGALQLQALRAEGGLLSPPGRSRRQLEVIGDSTSAGYGVRGRLGDRDCYRSESHWLSYGAHAARALGAELSTIAVSGVGVTRNYASAAPTMLALYDRVLTNDPRRAEHVQPADAVVVNLGANDVNDGKGDPGLAFEYRYRQLLHRIRARHPWALIVCMLAPTLSGAKLALMQRRIRSAIALGRDRRVIWFDGIATQTADHYACAYHADRTQHARMGELLAAELRRRLAWDLPPFQAQKSSPTAHPFGRANRPSIVAHGHEGATRWKANAHWSRVDTAASGSVWWRPW